MKVTSRLNVRCLIYLYQCVYRLLGFYPVNHPCVIYEIYTRVWVLVILQWMSALCANLTITYMAQRVICVEIIVNCPQTARQGLYSKSYRSRVHKAFQNQDQDQAQVKN